MYARITTYKVKLGTYDEISEKIEEMKPEILAIPGIKHWISTGNDDGSCAIIAIYESKEAAEAATSKAMELFGRFAEYYESPPQPWGYDVLHMESN